MKKYTLIITLSIAIIIIFIFCMINNKPIIIGNSKQKEVEKDSFLKKIKLDIPKILNNEEGLIKIEKEQQPFCSHKECSISIQNNQK